MTSEAILTIGQQVFIEDREHQFTRLITPDVPTADGRRDLQFEEVRTAHRFTMTHAEFDRLILDKKIRCPSILDRSGDEVPEGERDDKELRDLRQTLLRAYDENPVAKTDKALSQFVKDTMERLDFKSDWTPSGATLRTWTRTRGSKGDRRRKHMGRRRESGRKSSRLDPIVEAVIKEKSDQYFQKAGVYTTDVHAAVRTEIANRNIERMAKGLNPIRPPCRKTVWERVTSDMRYDNTKRKYGTKKANQMFKPQKTYQHPKKILELVLIDDTVIDCHVIDDEFPVVVGRPRLSLAVDSYSRCIVGCEIGFSDPSVETAMATLRNVVRPKTDLKERFPDIRGELMGGVPQTVMFDRAWGFVGSSMIDALDDVGISLVLAPAGMPEYKGRVEHVFDTLNKRIFHKLPGAIPFKPHKLRENGVDAVRDARLTLAQLRQLTMQAIIDYNDEFHTGLKDTPARLWNEQARQGISYPQDLHAIDLACAKLAPPRILSNKGIELHGVQYCSPAVFDLLNDMLPNSPKRNRRKGGVEVKVKYLPEDISKVFVWNTVRNKYVEVACLEERYTKGLSEFHHKKVEAFRKERALSWTSEDDRCRARTLLNTEATSQLNSRLIGNRRRAQKILDRDNVAVLSPVIKPRPSHSDGAQIIPVESMSNRVNGDQPERASVRKRRPTKRAGTSGNVARGRQPVGTIVISGHQASDPFADLDRDAMIAKIRNGASS